MKKYLLYPAFVCTAALATACQQDDGPTLPEPVSTEVALAIETVTCTSIRTAVTPKPGTSRYFYAIGTAQDAAAFADGTLEGIVEVLSNESARPLFRDLRPQTGYTLFAQAEDAFGRKGAVATAPATTGAEAPVVDVEIKRVAGDGIEAVFHPNAYAATYDFALATEADRAAFEDGSLEGNVRMGSEPCRRTFEAIPDRTYTLYARAYGPDGDTGEVVALPVATPLIPWMYIDMKEYNAMYCNFEADWNDACTGVKCWAGPRSQFDALCEQAGGIDALTALYRPSAPQPLVANYQLTNADSSPGDDPFVVLAMFWGAGNVWQEYRIYEFPPYEYDASLPIPDGFSYELLELTQEKIHVRVGFDESTKSVYAAPLSEEQYATLSEQEVFDMLFDPHNWGTSSKTYYKEWIYSGFGEETERFIIAAVGCNANGRRGASKVHYAFFDLKSKE